MLQKRGRWVGTVGTGIKGGTCQLWCQSVNGAAIAIGRETALVTKCVLAVHWLEGDLSRTFPLFNGDAVLACCSYRITWAEKLMLLLGKAGKHPGNVARCSVCFVPKWVTPIPSLPSLPLLPLANFCNALSVYRRCSNRWPWDSKVASMPQPLTAHLMTTERVMEKQSPVHQARVGQKQGNKHWKKHVQA